eukprot:1725811-Rhodomonas_salina.1
MSTFCADDARRQDFVDVESSVPVCHSSRVAMGFSEREAHVCWVSRVCLYLIYPLHTGAVPHTLYEGQVFIVAPARRCACGER